MYIGLHVKYRHTCQILIVLEFLKRFSKYTEYQIPYKSVLWETKFSMRTGGRTDRQTDMTKLTVAQRNYATAPRKP